MSSMDCPTHKIVDCVLNISHGCLVLNSEELNLLACELIKNIPTQAQCQRLRSRGSSFHITVIPRHEFHLSDIHLLGLVNSGKKFACVPIGIGSVSRDNDVCWYLVIYCAEINILCKKLGIINKDLHCTLGFLNKDIHGLPKGVFTVRKPFELDSLHVLQCMTDIAKIHGYANGVVRFDVVEYLWLQAVEHQNSDITIFFKYKFAYFILLQFQDNDFAARIGDDLLSCHCLEGLYIYCLILTNLRRTVDKDDVNVTMIFDRISGHFSSCDMWHHCLPRATAVQSEMRHVVQSKRRDFISSVLNHHISSAKFDKNLKVFSIMAKGPLPISSSTITHRTDSLIEDTDNLQYSLRVNTLPRNFGWIVSNVICAGAIPNHTDAYLALAASGVTDVICLLETPPDDTFTLSPEISHNITFHYFCVTDRCAISTRDLEAICDILDATVATHSNSEGAAPSSKRRMTYVHCHGGVGRTALALAAHHIRSAVVGGGEGVGPGSAVSEFLREKCGRVVKLSSEQSARLEEWWRHCIQIYSQPPPIPSVSSLSTSSLDQREEEEEGGPRTIGNKLTTVVDAFSLKVGDSGSIVGRGRSRGGVLPSVMVLCGVPGAGKSTFAKAVEAACAHLRDDRGRPLLIRVCKDDMRGKGEVETVALEAVSRGAAVVVDNCNVSPDIRELWASRAKDAAVASGVGLRVDGTAVCVHFATDVSECSHRAQHRRGHPTLSGPRAAAVVQTEATKFVSPTIAEGFVEVVSLYTPEDVDTYLGRLGLPPIEGVEPLAVDGDIRKFPRTPHLLDSRAATRDDKILDVQARCVLIGSGRMLVVEEKLDGANMGISITTDGKIEAQNRSHRVDSSYHEQFKPLDKWLATHASDLWQVLEPGRHVLYGEWLHAVHSVQYNRLPDWFVAFDLFDRVTNTFTSRDELERRLEGTSLHIVPLLARRTVDSLGEALALVEGPAMFGDGKREGIVLRLCEDDALQVRAKLVRGDFIARMQEKRWNHTAIRINKLAGFKVK